MYHKTIPFRRAERRNHISKRVFIGLHCMYWESLKTDIRRRGQLAKGKIHCSCPLCACKSTKLLGKTYNSLAGYPASDKRKFDSLSDSLSDYLAG